MNYAPLLLPLGLALTAVAVVVLAAALQLSLKHQGNVRSSPNYHLSEVRASISGIDSVHRTLTRNDVYITNVVQAKACLGC